MKIKRIIAVLLVVLLMPSLQVMATNSSNSDVTISQSLYSGETVDLFTISNKLKDLDASEYFKYFDPEVYGYCSNVEFIDHYLEVGNPTVLTTSENALYIYVVKLKKDNNKFVKDDTKKYSMEGKAEISEYDEVTGEYIPKIVDISDLNKYELDGNPYYLKGCTIKIDEPGDYLVFSLIDCMETSNVYLKVVGQDDSISTPSSWAVAEIDKAKENNLVTENVLNNYQQDITREEFCELVVKLYEALSGKEAIVPDTNKFTDTDNIEILKANALGLVNGVSETEFAPNANITREQIAAMIYRTLEKVDESLIMSDDKEVKFADKASISSYALEAVGFMSEKGILNGIGNNKVDPKGNATREHGILLINRTFELFN